MDLCLHYAGRILGPSKISIRHQTSDLPEEVSHDNTYKKPETTERDRKEYDNFEIMGSEIV